MASEWHIGLLADSQGFWKLLVGAVVTASELRREKREQMERHLAKNKRRQDENSLFDCIAP